MCMPMHAHMHADNDLSKKMCMRKLLFQHADCMHISMHIGMHICMHIGMHTIESPIHWINNNLLVSNITRHLAQKVKKMTFFLIFVYPNPFCVFIKCFNTFSQNMLIFIQNLKMFLIFSSNEKLRCVLGYQQTTITIRGYH